MRRNEEPSRLAQELRRASGPMLIFAVLSVVAVAVGAGIVNNLSGNKPWEKYDQYRVSFESLKGVVPSRTDMRLAGVRAGSITDTKVVDGRPVLTISLERKYSPLYRDARVVLRPQTPLEDMSIDITSRGSPRAGRLGEDEILPAKQTAAPVEVGRVLNIFDPDTRQRLGILLRQLGRGASDNGERLRAALAELGPFLETAGRMSRALADRRHQLARLVHNFERLSDVLARRDRQVSTLVRSGQQTVTALAGQRGPLGETLSALPGVLADMRSSFAELEATEAHLDPALRALLPAARALPDGADALQRLSLDAIPAFNALRRPVRSLRPLARTLRPTARQLAAALRPLKRQAPQIDRSTTLAVPCLPQIQSFLNRALSTTKWGDSGTYVVQVRTNLQQRYSLVEHLKEADWRILPPCFTGQKESGR
jgi:ABC-type transporter Mla subunit MlaD